MKTLAEIGAEAQEFKKFVNQEAENRYLKFTKLLLQENNPYPVGSIIEDHVRIIEVKKIRFSVYSPSCVYEGVELTKKLVPKKIQRNDVIWQSNVEKVHYLPPNQ